MDKSKHILQSKKLPSLPLLFSTSVFFSDTLSPMAPYPFSHIFRSSLPLSLPSPVCKAAPVTGLHINWFSSIDIWVSDITGMGRLSCLNRVLCRVLILVTASEDLSDGSLLQSTRFTVSFRDGWRSDSGPGPKFKSRFIVSANSSPISKQKQKALSFTCGKQRLLRGIFITLHGRETNEPLFKKFQSQPV